MLFWIGAAVMCLVCAAVLLRTALAAPRAAAAPEAVQVYKDQLTEIDSDLARGVLSASEAETLRTEVSRRLLAAADAGPSAGQPAPRDQTYAMLAIVLGLVVGGGFTLYSLVGAPGKRDMPLAQRLAANAERYANRPSQEELLTELVRNNAAPQPVVPDDPAQLELLDQLRTILESRPDDLRGHQLLADNSARLRDWQAAAGAQREVIRIKGDEAKAEDHADLAEYLILAVNGYVSPEAEAALRRTLELAPGNPRGRYYSGLSAVQAGRADLAYDLWVRLLAESRADAPWVQAINMQIRDVALAAGRPVPPGPSADDIEAASQMSPEEQQQMIEGMVARLSERLATEGGPAEDWARLIRAYGVMGERARASTVWNEAQQVFEGSAADLNLIRQAARDAEVSQ